MKPKPMPGHVLVRIMPDPPPPANLILPPSAQRTLNPRVWGIVAGVGKSTPLYDMTEIKRGGCEKVLVQRGVGTYVEIDGQEHRIMHINDIILVVPTKENL